MKTKLRSPACAACAATEFARFPVDAQATVLNPNSSAFDSATDVTRSLNEFVGFSVSFLMHTSPSPSSDGEAVRPDQRREAGAEVDGGVPLDREQVLVSPHAERSRGDLLAADRLRDRRVVVAHLERAEAPLAGEDRRDVVLASALPTPKSLDVGHVLVLLLVNGLPFGLDALAVVFERLERSSGGPGPHSGLSHRSGIGTWLPGGGAGCRGVKGPVPQPLWMSALFAEESRAAFDPQASHYRPPGRSPPSA